MTDIASHRGGALLWPENSRIAFENTAALPVEQVEFDVHPSRDGRLVVIHDATLDRTTDGQGPVAERSWAELSGLILKGTGGQRMLLLEEVIEIFRPTRMLLRLEIKADPQRRPYPGQPHAIVRRLREQGVLDRTVLTSFQIETVQEVARHGDPRSRIWLVAPDLQRDVGGIASVLRIAEAHGIRMLGIHQRLLGPDEVDACREAGFGIGGWGCNDAAVIGRVLALGVDVFTTDRPDLALALRR
jgi:glycerophosphoryl diester phosphodiesterase